MQKQNNENQPSKTTIPRFRDFLRDPKCFERQVGALDEAVAGEYELVQNKPNTANDKSPAGSWKKFWEQKAQNQKWPECCAVVGCPEKADDGAHVRDQSGKVYIVPLCSAHNHPTNKDKMRIRKGIFMAPIMQ